MKNLKFHDEKFLGLLKMFLAHLLHAYSWLVLLFCLTDFWKIKYEIYIASMKSHNPKKNKKNTSRPIQSGLYKFNLTPRFPCYHAGNIETLNLDCESSRRDSDKRLMLKSPGNDST